MIRCGVLAGEFMFNNLSLSISVFLNSSIYVIFIEIISSFVIRYAHVYLSHPIQGVPVANIRHRRSRSTGERWLEHRAPNPVPLGTILQPYYRNRKSVTKLTDARDITNPKTTKYCLVSQAADTDGEVETRLIKGNVIPTTGGGAQVVFDDVECLKQSSPIKGGAALAHRKRPSHPPQQQQHQQTPRTTPPYCSASGSGVNGAGSSSSGLLTSGEVASKCSIGIEGHTNTKKSKY